MNISDLASSNPWWFGSERIYDIPEVKKWANTKSNLNYIPRVFHKFKLSSDMIYTLRGPRQVGKTTLVYLLIKKLIEEGDINPDRVFYYTMDTVSDNKELLEIIRIYIRWIRSRTTERAYIFLDEIASVPGWQRIIKSQIDNNSLANFFVLVTASHTIDLASGAERLVGRQGTEDPLPNKILLPMKFIEYVELRDIEIREWIKKNKFKRFDTRRKLLLGLFGKKTSPYLTELELYMTKLNDLLIDYAITGGVVTAVDAYHGSGQIPINLYNDYKEYLLGEALKSRKREDFLIETMTQVFETHTTPVGWETLKRNTNIRSRDTLRSYVNFVQNCYILSVIKKLQIKKGIADHIKNKKIYFHDPFFFHSLRAWIYGLEDPYASSFEYVKDNDNLSFLLESIVCSHLLRWLSNYYNSPLIDPTSRLFFWRGRKGKEVDFIFNINDLNYPIEVKYRNKIRREDTFGLLNFLSGSKSLKGILLTKNTVDYSHEHYIFLPISLFLCLI